MGCRATATAGGQQPATARGERLVFAVGTAKAASPSERDDRPARVRRAGPQPSGTREFAPPANLSLIPDLPTPPSTVLLCRYEPGFFRSPMQCNRTELVSAVCLLSPDATNAPRGPARCLTRQGVLLPRGRVPCHHGVRGGVSAIDRHPGCFGALSAVSSARSAGESLPNVPSAFPVEERPGCGAGGGFPRWLQRSPTAREGPRSFASSPLDGSRSHGGEVTSRCACDLHFPDD